MDNQFEQLIFQLLLKNTTRASEQPKWFQCDQCWETHGTDSPMCAFHNKCYYLLYTAEAEALMLQELVESTTWCLQSSRDDQFTGPQVFVCEFDITSPVISIPIDFQATMAVRLFNIDRLQDALTICWIGFKISESGIRPAICSGHKFSTDIGPIKHANGTIVNANLFNMTESDDETDTTDIVSSNDDSQDSNYTI